MTAREYQAVLVTGASKGIGEACALRLAAAGFRVFAGIRSESDAGRLAGAAAPGCIVPVRIDVTDPDSIGEAARQVQNSLGDTGLTGLVNNAGIAVAGPLEFLPIDQIRRQLEVNVIGQVAVTQAFLPSLRVARGRIVFIGSISGRVALPFAGAYAASKHALEAITDALRVELSPWGIEVSIVQPGVIATPIWATSAAAAELDMAGAPPELESYYGSTLALLRRMLDGIGSRGLPADSVAKVVETALTATRPRTRYLVGRDARLKVLLEVLPDRLRDRLVLKGLRRATR